MVAKAHLEGLHCGRDQNRSFSGNPHLHFNPTPLQVYRNIICNIILTLNCG
jgi:hypothetical protein